MKTKPIILSLSLTIATILTAFAQGFEAPAQGKSAIYFVRVTKVAFMSSFEYFHGDQFVGKWKGQNYMRMEVDPGENLFWVSSENKEFLTADLESGKTYIVVVDVKMGFGKARVGLTPITTNDRKLFSRASEIINDKDPQVTSESEKKKIISKLEKKNFIQEKLDMYENVWKDEKDFNHISKDMAIPEAEL